MAPPKFDDLCKTAKDVLTEDYQVSGQGFKSKVKTNFEGLSDIGLAGDGGKKEGATITTDVGLNFSAAIATPAKLTFKFPKPFGMKGFAIDKLEMDKAGGVKLECAIDEALHKGKDFKVECKSDLKGLDTLKLGVSYTGIAALLAKAEFNATKPAKYAAEASYAVGSGLTVGAKSTPASIMDIGAQYVHGPLFFAAAAQENFGVYILHAHYKARDDLNVAAHYKMGGKESGNFSAGLKFNVCAGTLFKAKVLNHDNKLSCSTSVKYEIAKGTTVTAGTNVPLDGKGGSWGMQFNVE